jgi:hypothetical protein
MIHTDGVRTVAHHPNKLSDEEKRLIEQAEAAADAAWEAGRAEREADAAAFYADNYHAQWDDDPSPYDGTYSEC